MLHPSSFASCRTGVTACLTALSILAPSFVCASRAAVEDEPPVSRSEMGLETDETRAKNTIGMSGGAGLGTLAFGGKSKHDLWFFNAHYGRVVADHTSGDSFWGGRWMVLGEISVGREINRDRNWTASISPLVRYLFGTSGRLVPFIEGGYGLTWTDIGEPDLGGEIQFKGQAGAGFYWFVHPDVACTFQYRFIHYSNAGFNRPNQGVNVHTGLVGLSYFF